MASFSCHRSFRNGSVAATPHGLQSLTDTPVHRESNKGNRAEVIFAEQDERGGRKGDGEKKGGGMERRRQGGGEREGVEGEEPTPSASWSGCHSSTQVHSTGREKKRRGDHKGFESGPC